MTRVTHVSCRHRRSDLTRSVGLAYRAKEKGDGYADAVRAMINAGAIPLAVTNVSELCLWMESSNKVICAVKLINFSEVSYS